MVKESVSFKCEQFFAKNWKYVGGLISLAILVMAWEMSSISSRMKSLEKIVHENNGKVVLTTTDGRAIRVVKEPLRAEYLKQFAVSTYLNHFVVSRSQMTSNFSRSSFNQLSEVLSEVQQLGVIYSHFLDTKEDKERGITINRQAIGEFSSYIKWLISAVAQDRLPEFINIKGHSIDKYEYNGNKFQIEIRIQITAQSYSISQDKYISQNGEFKIISEGTFDLAKGSEYNPYGMRIEKLRISPVVKG